MTDTIDSGAQRLPSGWRIAGWGALLALLALPAIAMQFTGEVAWGPEDFLFGGIMLAALGTGVELAVRYGRSLAHTAGLVAAALAGFATVWINAAVGIIGEEPINLAYFVIVLAALAAALAGRLRAAAMSVVVAAVVAGGLAVALAAELTGVPDWGPALFVVALWLPALVLLRIAARRSA